jgi:protein CpxP
MPKLPLVLALMLSLNGPLAAQPSQPPSLDEIHDALRLRPDQEQAWQIFQQASRPTPQDEARQRDAFQRMGSLQAPQRFDLSIQMMRSDLDQMERQASALKAFYATLSPDQQAAFDRETAPPRQ